MLMLSIHVDIKQVNVEHVDVKNVNVKHVNV
jgi:hypothetical protein